MNLHTVALPDSTAAAARPARAAAPAHRGCIARFAGPLIRAAVAVLVLAFTALQPARAVECDPAPLVAAAPYAVADAATALPYGQAATCVSAAGMAFTKDGTLLVLDASDGHLYAVSRGGGAGTGALKLNQEAYPAEWCPRQIAFSNDRAHLYMTRQYCGQGGDVVEIDQDDGHVIRTVAQGLPCATGLAFDPLGTDLFVSGSCAVEGTDFIYRVANPETAHPAVTIYATTGRAGLLRFDEEGDLWTTTFDATAAARTLVRIAGTGSRGPGAVTTLLSVGAAHPLYTAIAVAPALDRADPVHPLLFVLLADGGVRTVDLRAAVPAVGAVATGGAAAGGLVTDHAGCLFISAMNRVHRLSALDGSCNLGVVPAPVDSVAKEYYNAGLGHYFMTATDTEKTSVETGGAGPGWVATGYYFNVGGNGPVCRFYGNRAINPASGNPYGPNSHFYTIEQAECAAVRLDPGWVFESPRVFGMVRTSSPGTCPDGTRPVFRAYNNRALQNDSNHRYTTSPAIYQQMTAAGWRAEGVVFCAQI